MRVLHLAWEYPPVIYGGLGRHVHALAKAQAAAGHDVVVITQAPNPAAPARMPWVSDKPVRVIRATIDAGAHRPGDLWAHIAWMEHAFVGQGIALTDDWEPDVIHAHDWMVAHAAVALRDRCPAPLTTTIHATEAGRNLGWVSSDLSAAIHGVEWWLANTSDAVIACSQAMRDELHTLFGIESAHVVPNGIELADWQPSQLRVQQIRAQHADADPLIVYTGRVEWEKGVQTLLSALPALRVGHPRIRLLVAGRGTYLDDLRGQAQRLSLNGSVRFLGWVSEDDLRAIVAAGDLAVAPSLYEPFGLVALEAAAIGTPLVVSRSGGLAEFANNERRALTFTPGDPASLAAAVDRALADPHENEQRARRASESVTCEYSWRDVAAQAVAVYERSREGLGPGPQDPRQAAAAARHAIREPQFDSPPGKLLDLAQ